MAFNGSENTTTLDEVYSTLLNRGEYCGKLSKYIGSEEMDAKRCVVFAHSKTISITIFTTTEPNGIRTEKNNVRSVPVLYGQVWAPCRRCS